MSEHRGGLTSEGVGAPNIPGAPSTPGTPGRPVSRAQGHQDTVGENTWGAVAGAVIVMLMWLIGLDSMHVVLKSGTWDVIASLLIATVFLISVTVHVLVPGWRVRAVLVGALVAASGLSWLAWSGGRIDAWWAESGALIDQIRQHILTGDAPLGVTHPMEDLLVPAILAAATASALALVGADLFVLAALVPSALVIISPMVTGLRADAPHMVAMALCWLALLWAGSPPRPRPLQYRGGHPALILGGGAARATVAAVVLAMSVAVVHALPPSRDRLWNEGGIVPGLVDAHVPDVTVELGAQLRRGSTAEAFRYSGGEAGEAMKFTLATLGVFEGGRWLPSDGTGRTVAADGTDRAASSALTADTVLALSAVRDASRSNYSGALEAVGTRYLAPEMMGGVSADVVIEVSGMVSTWLPVLQSTAMVAPVQGALSGGGADEAGSVDVDAWGWVPGTDSVRTPTNVTRRGQTYLLWGWGGQRSEDLSGILIPTWVQDWQLLVDPTATAAAPPDMASYLALPDGLPEAISVAAQQVTGDVMSAPAKARALELWFTGGEFTYDEAVPYVPESDPSDPYRTMSALLEVRSGFCVHYASTFAVMMRSLGVPSRVAVGYASRSQGEGWTSVQGRDLHAWPEIHVDGLGWVAYEPTPGGPGARSEGREEILAQGAQSVPGDEAASASAAQSSVAGEQSGINGSAAEGQESSQSGASPVVDLPAGLDLRVLGGVVAVLVAVGVGGPAALRSLRRWRRWRTVRSGKAGAVEAAWAEVVDLAVHLGHLSASGYGGAVPRARTPEALCEFLVDTGALDAEAGAACSAIAEAVVARRYGPPEVETGGTTAEWLEAALALVEKALRASAPH